MEVFAMKKFLKIVLAAAGLMATAAAPALAYEGYWYSQTNPEYMELGDNDDGTYLALGSTPGYCGRPGNSYSQMRRVLRNNGDEDITWWIQQTCDDGFDSYVKVCVENWRGQQACSTYRDYGWQ